MYSCLSLCLSHSCTIPIKRVFGTCPPICYIHVHIHVRLSVCDTYAPPPPCTHVLWSFLYLYASTPAYPSHSYAQCLLYMSVFNDNRPCLQQVSSINKYIYNITIHSVRLELNLCNLFPYRYQIDISDL